VVIKPISDDRLGIIRDNLETRKSDIWTCDTDTAAELVARIDALERSRNFLVKCADEQSDRFGRLHHSKDKLRAALKRVLIVCQPTLTLADFRGATDGELCDAHVDVASLKYELDQLKKGVADDS